jgi:hypothetical protein
MTRIAWKKINLNNIRAESQTYWENQIQESTKALHTLLHQQRILSKQKPHTGLCLKINITKPST